MAAKSSDISKLQQIMSLKQLGFSLEEIKRLIEDTNYDSRQAIQLHIERLNEQIRIQDKLRSRLKELCKMLDTHQEVTADKLFKIVEMMRMTQNYFTPEQMEQLKMRGEMLGIQKIKEVEDELSVLIAKIRGKFNKGVPCEDPAVTQLAKRWIELVELFTGADSEISKSAERYYKENPDRAAQMGIDGKLWGYIKGSITKL